MSKTRKATKNKVNSVYTVIPAVDKDIIAEISIRAIKNNIEYLRKKSGTDIMPVLKANAYGHGIVEMARVVRKLGIKYIGVATLGEAILLRKSGDKGRILAWLYDVRGPDLKDAFQMDIDIAIFDEQTLPEFIDLIPKNKKIKVTVFVDTGINRAGVRYEKALETFLAINNCPKLQLEGMMSHLICSEEKNSPIIHEQLRKFRTLRAQLFDMKIDPPLVHIANTCGCLNYDVSDFTLARSGSGLYGIPYDKILDKHFDLTTTVKTYIIQIKDIQKGEGVGYNWKYVAPHNMKIGILPIGYADIIPWDTSLKLHVYIRNKKRKVLGSISMDQIIVEMDDKDQVNDEVIIFGNGINCPQTILDIGQQTDTNPYEILCHLGYRVRRTYIP
jgi:alanine racemase